MGCGASRSKCPCPPPEVATPVVKTPPITTQPPPLAAELPPLPEKVPPNAELEKALKYSGRLIPLDVGHVVTIVGKVSENAEYFNVFFGSDTGLDEEFDDIQFHIAANFEKNQIVRNSYSKSEGWGEPEIEQNRAPGNSLNPIKRGNLFKIEIFIDAEMFHVTIDNKPFCNFKHRSLLKDIHRINVYGGVDKIYQISHTTPKEISKSLNDESLINVIPATKFGSVLAFSGMPQGAENGSFEILLSDDKTRRILFRLKANFNEKKIYGSSQNEEMKWCQEHIIDPEEFPFEINKMFKLAIGFTSQEFVISTDGIFSMKYPHEGKMSENPLKIEILSSNGMSMDVFGISNYARGEKVKSVQASFVYVADGSKKAELNKKWNPEKSLERIYALKEIGMTA